MPTRAEKPLLGFGGIGWALLPIAAALFVVWVTGYDLQLRLFRGIQFVFGSDAMLWYVSAVHIWHTMNATSIPPGMGFGLWGICVALIAFQIYPNRLPWWRWAPVIVWGIAAPPLYIRLLSMLRKVPGSALSIEANVSIVQCVMSILLAALLMNASRSTRAAIAILSLITLSTVVELVGIHYMFTTPEWFDRAHLVLRWAWHPLLLCALLLWAVPARLRARKPWACPKCGYDLRNLNSDRCPECGGAIRAAP